MPSARSWAFRWRSTPTATGDKRAYPDRRVWELSRQYKLTWLINSDAHEVAHLCDEAGVGGTEAFARELGIPVTEWFDW